MRLRRSVLFSVVAIILMFSLSAATQNLSPKLASKELKIKNVLILPAQVEIQKDTMKGGEEMGKESENVSAGIKTLVAEALKKKGFTVLDDPFTQQALDSNSDLKYAVADAQKQYDVLGQQLFRKEKDVKKGRFTMGDTVSKVNLDDKADAIVFIRGAGQKKSRGKKAFVAVMRGKEGGPIEIIGVSIGLVDAHSGEVLAIAETFGTGDFVDKTDKVLGKRIEKSLKNIPAPQ